MNSTPGDALADSYVSLAYALTYFESTANRGQWILSDAETQESLLISATRYLDQFIKWYGAVSTSSQALRWPRVGAVDRDGELVDSDVIPKQVLQATCELAYHILINGDLRMSSKNTSRVKVAVIDISYKSYDDVGIPQFILSLLSSLGESEFSQPGSISTPRLVRV